MKIVVFGTGDYYIRYRKWVQTQDIVAIIDNSEQKQGTVIDGIEIATPLVCAQLDFDYVVILSFYVREMKEQLFELGIDGKKILHFYELYKIASPKNNCKYILRREKKSVLLLSHDLNLGGPSLALMQLADTLVKLDYQVVVGSMIDGPLKDVFEKNGYDVIVDADLQIGKMSEIEWTHQFDMVWCNTVNYCVFLSERPSDISVFWWLHDAIFFYGGIEKELLKKIEHRNLEIFSVGRVPQEAMNTYRPDFHIDDLLYAVPEVEIRKKHRDKTCRFIIIGYIENRKGQDILLDAIKEISLEKQNKLEFYFVGQDSSELAVKLKKEAKKFDNVHFLGTVDRAEINNQLDLSDALICPSREDPMPTVVAEAMMHRKPCIISSAVGVTKYISNMRNGIVFENEDATALKEAIQWLADNEDMRNELGNNAYLVYQKIFSRETFEKKIWDIVNGETSRKEI